MGKSIQIKNLSFSYGDHRILKQLNLIIGKKTFLSIIGPNGSGKTTLLKNMARNLRPDQGVILIDGRELAGYSTLELARDVAVVHQNPDISAEFTVYDVVMMGRHPYIGRFKRENQNDLAVVEQALKGTNTFHLQDRYISEISGGERQRVMIAKALAQEPQILLLDEPTSFLDIHHQIEILELLKQLNREKEIAIIAVIHDLNLAARYSDEVLLLNRGSILALGSTEKVMKAEQLQKAYEMEMIVDRNVYTGSLQICPISVSRKSKPAASSIHIIGGGGMAKDVLQRCYQEGYALSLGVVNRGDSDAELGRKLGVVMVEEEPFCDIGQDSLKKACLQADNASVVILTSIPFGHGNLSNLIIAKDQLEKGKPVLHYNTYKPGVPFDYVNGDGEKCLKELQNRGMKTYEDLDRLMNDLEAMIHEA